MLFSTKSLLWGFVSMLLLARGVYGDACSEGPINQPVTTVGQPHSDGVGFCYTKWNSGLTVVGIEAWTIRYHIKGISLKYSDGTTDSAGQAVDGGGDGDHVIFNWDKDAPITDMKTAPNKAGDGLGHLSFSVGGKDFTISSDYKDEEKVNVGSGILLGAAGQAGGFIYQWTPAFLGTMDNEATITNLKFDQDLDTLNKQQAGIEQLSLSEVYIENSNPVGSTGNDEAYQFGVDLTKQMSVTDSNTQTHTFGVDLSVKFGGTVGIPLIAEASFEVSAGASYSYQDATTHTSEDAKTVTFRWNQGSTKDSDFIKPGHAKHCKAYAYQGHYSGDYTKDVQITVDGKQFTYQERGTMDTISYSSASGSCEDILSTNIPADAKTVQAKDTMGGAKRAIPFNA